MATVRNTTFEKDNRLPITTQSVGGVVEVFQQQEETTRGWINKVCSKGGTTRAAIDTFEEQEVKAKIKKGIFAAYNRAVELGNS
mgnify:CR=1 FL=1